MATFPTTNENAGLLHAVRGWAGHYAVSTLFTALLWIQGLYFLVTGIWPLVSIDTFQAVTGPKTDNLATGLLIDHWLVKTAGVLITAIGITLLTGAWRRSSSVELAVLAISASVGLAFIDVFYVARQVIAPIYLLDAVIELALIGGWAIVYLRTLDSSPPAVR